MKSFTVATPTGHARVSVRDNRPLQVMQAGVKIAEGFPRIVAWDHEEDGVMVLRPNGQWEGRTALTLTLPGTDPLEDVKVARTSAIFVADGIPGALIGGRYEELKRRVTGWRLGDGEPRIETWGATLNPQARACCGRAPTPPAPEIQLPALAFDL